MRKLFLLRGFDLKQSAAGSVYAPAVREFEQKGYDVVPFDMTWEGMTHTAYVDLFIERHGQQVTDDSVIVGNSFGAVAALLLVGKVHPQQVILCSMSPFFTETLVNSDTYDYSVKRFGRDRTEDLKTYSILKLAKKANNEDIKITFMYGEQEKIDYFWLVDFVKKYHQYFDGAKLIEAKGAPHSLRDPAYFAAVAELL